MFMEMFMDMDSITHIIRILIGTTLTLTQITMTTMMIQILTTICTTHMMTLTIKIGTIIMMFTTMTMMTITTMTSISHM